MVQILPHGAWPSPVSIASLAESGIAVGELRCDGGRLYWLESRPTEGGRMVLMTRGADGAVRQLTPEGFNLRTRVHEYGGAPYAVNGEDVWFASFRDQLVYRQHGETITPVTPAGYRYAEITPVPGGGLIAVREDHSDPADIKNAIVRLTGEAGDAGTLLWGGSDFVAYPALCADGTKLAWIAWDHPNMPWDVTTLYVADLGPNGLSNVTAIAGGKTDSVMEPRWAANGSLFYIDDKSGFWNLYMWRAGETFAVWPMSAEFAGPLWQLGQSNYAVMDGDRLAAIYSDAAGDHLVVIAGGEAREIETAFASLRGIRRLDDQRVALISQSPNASSTLMTVNLTTGSVERVHCPSPVWLAPAHISEARAITFKTAGGREGHALYYPPVNAEVTGPYGTPPPLIVEAHGGPTSQAGSAFNLSRQFWTTRGFAVVDVDYSGSSGYGRDYRRRLNGQWGIVDVEDVIAAAKHLIDQGLADPQKIAIHGGSAGGFTVLAALSQSDVFKAGGNFYGVSDLEALARDTHKFESRYLDGLIGPYPEAKAVYEERSPIHHLEGFTAPLIILQGAEDPIVPPNQSRMIRDALKAKGVPVAYLEFAGEGHGFRRAENTTRAKEAELAFYGAVFGFEPADKLPPLEIENL